MPFFAAALRLGHMAGPAAPAAGQSSLYFKTDGGLYTKNSFGTERPILAPDAAIHPNPSFESGTSTPGTGWTDGWSTGTTWSWDTTSAIEGLRSLKAVTGSGEMARVGNAAALTVAPRSTLTISAWTKALAPGNFRIIFFTSLPDGEPEFWLGTHQDAHRSVGTSWSRSEASFVVPAGHTKARIYFEFNPGTHWIDATGSWVSSQPPVLDDTGWLTPTLNSPWIQYDNTNWPARYRRLNGVVYCKGLVRYTSGIGDQTITTLPEGFRPSTALILTSHDASHTVKSVYVYATGAIQVPSGTHSTWMAFNYSYPADQ